MNCCQSPIYIIFFLLFKLRGRLFFFVFPQDRVYVQQNGVDNVYNLGLILFRDLVSYLCKFLFSVSSLFFFPDCTHVVKL